MTHQDLRDLLHERVADETTTDLASGAWRAGRRLRHRRTLAAVGGVAAGAAAVSTAIAWVGSTPPDAPPSTDLPAAVPSPAPDVPSTTPDVIHPEARDARFRGVPVWWSPDQAEERALPYLEGSPFPEILDLGVRTKALVGPARAAFGIGRDEVVLVGFRGSAVSLDVSAFGPVSDGGNRLPPIGPGSLSPSGETLLVKQDDALHLYDVGTGTWTEVTTGTDNADVAWFDDETLFVPGAPDGRRGRLLSTTGSPLGEGVLPEVRPGFEPTSAPYGRAVTSAGGTSSAQAWDGGLPGLPERGRAGDLLGLGFLAVDSSVAAGVLTMTTVSDETDVRSPECCAVVGWLGDGTVVYETRQRASGLVAWDVGTDSFHRVTTIEGAYDFASYAELG